MGIRQISLVILVFILLSSTVYAVDFKWALGFPGDTIVDNEVNEWTYEGRRYITIYPTGEWERHCFTGDRSCRETGRMEVPFIAVQAYGSWATRYRCGGTSSDSCQQYLKIRSWYQEKEYWNSGRIVPPDRGFNGFDYHLGLISDNINFWNDHSNTNCNERNERCQDRCAMSLTYAPVVTSGFESVFPKSGIKYIGPVEDLIPTDLLPDNETIYVGTLTEKFGDILFWFGPAESEPTDPLKRGTNDYFDYINFCSDLNHNKICDNVDAEPCYDEGADWYGDPDPYVGGICCGADPVQILSDTGLESTNCTGKVYAERAYCGIKLDGRYEWAPANEVGAVHELLNCPGYSMVSDGAAYTNCKPGEPSGGVSRTERYEVIGSLDCPANTHSAIQSYYDAEFGGFLFRGTEGDNSGTLFSPDSGGATADIFNLCTYVQDSNAKYRLIFEENTPLDPPACDAGYSDIGELYVNNFHYAEEYSDFKGTLTVRVCGKIPESTAKAAKFFKIDSTSGTHGYLCSNGELFECKGDGASYSYDTDFVADTGVSTNDLVGSGGCPPKILAYWNFDAGTATDSISTYTGTTQGAASTTGKINGAIHLEVGDSVTLPADVPVTGSEFTVEAWINPTETSGIRKIIEKEDSFRIAIDDQLLIGALHTNQPMGDFGSRRVISNVWQHVALTYDGEDLKLYLNGIAVTDPTHSGDIVWSDKPIIIGSSFVGDIDDVAIYDKALRGSLIKRHAKMPSSYCQGTAVGLTENYYCAADAEWTTDLDIKDESSCNKAGFVWTGNFCCSEDDDFAEYYNDHDTPPADLSMVDAGGQTIAAHAGAQVTSAQIVLTSKKQFATIKGPAKLIVEKYSAESPDEIGACPPLDTNLKPIVVAPWETKTIKILSLGQAGDPCRYRHKIITAEPFLALGGCWDKDFVPIGHFSEPDIINYHGAFYSCGLPSSASELQIQDTQNDGQLVTPASTSCSDIKLNARGAGTHVVCNPGGKWQFTNNSVATTSSEIVWDVTGTNASQYGCCGEDQCWTGFTCVNIGDYYTDPTSGDSYFCEE